MKRIEDLKDRKFREEKKFVNDKFNANYQGKKNFANTFSF